MVDLKKFLPKKESEQEYFWSLLIEPGWVQAAIWKIENNEAKAVLNSSATPWNTDDDLISAADIALSSAIQGFPEDVNEPSKTVFGISSSWVKKGEISEGYLDRIKKLCSDLSLSPIGFVVLPEALAHYKKSTEGAPLNAVVLGIYKENLEVSVFSSGNLIGTSQVARSVSLEDDVAEGLARFANGKNIPSRFILYDGKVGELEDARQALLKVNWEDFDKLEILHTPKIEILSIDTKIHAVCLAGASELAGISLLQVSDELQNDTKSENEVEGHLHKLDSKGLVIDEEKNEISNNVVGETDKTFYEEEYVEKDESILDNVDKTPEDLGFVIDEDITSDNFSSQDGPDNEISQNIEKYHKNIQPVQEDKKDRKPSVFTNLGLKNKIDGLKKSLVSFLGILRMPKIPGISAGKKIFFISLIVLLLLVICGFVAWWFVPKSTVTIYLSPQKLGESLSISVDTTGGSTDLSKGILAGEKLSVSASGEKTKDTTGTKTVGDKAKGEIVLYRVGTEIELDENTPINGPGDLKFSTDSEVTVASGSASSPGKTSVKVTAQEIGAQYNLAGGTSFSVDDYSVSDIEAKNEDAFSGGSSREINAVSANDLEVLEEDLLNELSDQAKTKLLSETLREKYLIQEAVEIGVVTKNFSAKEGDEATSLKLSMEAEAGTVVIQKDVLNEYALQFLNGKVPQGYVLREEQISYEFDFEDEEDGLYEFKLKISANLLPQIDKEEIAKKLKGKYPKLAEDYLNKEVSGFVRAEIKIRPNLPDKLKTLPHVQDNIEVEFAAEK